MSEKIPTITSTTRRSVCPRSGKKEGSVTVEAALVLPLFMMALILIAGILNILYVHRQVRSALENSCRQVSAYAYPLQNGIGDMLPGGGAAALSTVWVQGNVRSELGKDALVQRLLDGTVNCLGSDLLGDGQTVTVEGYYTISLHLGPFRSGSLRFKQKVTMHGWNGYRTDGLSDDHDGEHASVYVTEYGTVYHNDPDCSYLNPSIRTVQASEVMKLRSDDGSIYYPCESCGGGEGTCYITTYGDRYHSDPKCSGLKRTIHEMPVSDAECIYGACSKCGR